MIHGHATRTIRLKLACVSYRSYSGTARQLWLASSIIDHTYRFVHFSLIHGHEPHKKPRRSNASATSYSRTGRLKVNGLHIALSFIFRSMNMEQEVKLACISYILFWDGPAHPNVNGSHIALSLIFRSMNME